MIVDKRLNNELAAGREGGVGAVLTRVMKKAVADVLALQRRYKVALRPAAYLLAVKRLTVGQRPASRG